MAARASLVAMCILFAACDSQQKRWSEATSANTIASYQQFLTRFPDSEHAREADRRIEALRQRDAVDSARRAGTTAALERVLEKYPGDAAAPELRAKLETLYFDQTAAIGSLAAWQSFLEKRPTSPHASKARERVEAILAERHAGFRDVKSIRIEIREQYWDADGVSLPFKTTISSVLPFAGVTAVEQGEADAVLAVHCEGEPLANQYNPTGSGISQTLYTGVDLRGTITLTAGKTRLSESFEHHISTPFFFTTSSSAPSTPDRAPFRKAYDTVVPLAVRELTGRAFGASTLIAEITSDRGERSIAAKALGRLKPVPVDRLTALLGHERGPVRSAAVEALGAARVSSAAQRILDAVRLDSSLSAIAAEAIGRMGRENVPLLLKGVDDPSAAVSGCAVEALGRIADRRATVPLIAKLATADPPMRCRVAKALSNFADRNAAVSLAVLLSDDDNSVRACTAAALSEQEGEDDSWEAPAVQEVLYDNRDPRLIDAVLAALDRDDPPATSAATNLISQIGDAAMPRIIQALEHPTPARRAGAARSLGGFYGDDRALAALRKTLESALGKGDSKLAEAACEGLATLGDDRGVGVLIKALDSTSDAVRAQAINALGSIGDDRAVAALKTMKSKGISKTEVETALAMIAERNGY
jgi:HEAT repeat protein